MVASKQELKQWVLANCFRPYGIGDYFEINGESGTWLLINLYEEGFGIHAVHLVQGTERFSVPMETWHHMLREGAAVFAKDQFMIPSKAATYERRYADEVYSDGMRQVTGRIRRVIVG